jgi:hypothetical protein
MTHLPSKRCVGHFLLTSIYSRSIIDAMKLICPNCGSFTSLNPVWVIKDAILEERSNASTTVKGKVRITLIQPYKYDETQYGILWCGACEEIFVVEKAQYHQEDDWEVVYPIPRKIVPVEIPAPIKSEFEEACLCFTIGAYRACASMCQRTLESLCQEKQVARLDTLRDQGIISSGLFDRANEIRHWAGMTKHAPIVDPVSRDDADQLLTYLNAVLDHVYVQPVRLDALRQKRKQIDPKG